MATAKNDDWARHSDIQRLEAKIDKLADKIDELRSETIPEMKTQAALAQQQQKAMIEKSATRRSTIVSLLVAGLTLFGKFLLDAFVG